MENKNYEVRTTPAEFREYRSTGNQNRRVHGRAIVFNRESKLLYENKFFYELILPSAMNDIIPKCDVFCTLNHDASRGILARSYYGTGTLTLRVDSKGLAYEFDSPRTTLGDELLESLMRGDIRGSSFKFCVADDGQKWSVRSDGRNLRVITKFSYLSDVSPCYEPAYADTSVALIALRNLENYDITQDMSPAQKRLYAQHLAFKKDFETEKRIEEMRKYLTPLQIELYEQFLRLKNGTK